ncbi:MAG: ribosome recycling factor [Nitrospirae bacterium]|jgi:ribosome recycling factor|nr:MAG: ribosome recycling factor [Nitrospirae bacterium 13_1_40CM_4_62_6]OLC80595.1 MAG: ribosome recycling factor [Nitrospirae bacterium 13_1_40CM_3_62_11]OLD41586.1 MAG: ribosome recycling factor [Nitrospirae bacterium 13_1_40CM_2_62_10]OLE42347.1 MAG: ribosome recycling factor [Nitrospirae bacterium 13_1_20CM_2_62_14]TLY42142.1 MAG: ribosome recycling factor [Nitrospirota bacterium]
MPSATKQKVIGRMEAALEHLKVELGGIRSGRASLTLLDGIKVDYYGTPTPLKQVATLAVPESRLLTVQPWEPPLIKEIERALLASGLGLTPSNDGKMIRIPIPPLSEERRRELIKLCKKHGEETKVHLRNIRREGNEELKRLQKESKLTEDDLRKAEAEVQKLTDQHVQKVDQILQKKEEEILEV